MYVYVYVCMYVHMCMYIRVHIYHICTYVYIYIYTCTYTHELHIYIYVDIDIYIYMYICIHAVEIEFGPAFRASRIQFRPRFEPTFGSKSILYYFSSGFAPHLGKMTAKNKKAGCYAVLLGRLSRTET